MATEGEEGRVVDSLLIALQRKQGVGAVESDWKNFFLEKAKIGVSLIMSLMIYRLFREIADQKIWQKRKEKSKFIYGNERMSDSGGKRSMRV